MTDHGSKLSGLALTDVPGLAAVLSPGLSIDDRGRPVPALVFVDLTDDVEEEILLRAERAISLASPLIVGIARGPLSSRFDRLGSLMTLTLVAERDESEPWQAGVSNLDATVERIGATVSVSPTASRTLDGLLRITETAAVDRGLIAESAAYSMLLAGSEFARWLRGRSPRAVPKSADPVLVSRNGQEGELLEITLNRPTRHNAFGCEVRDALAEALDLAALDSTITRVVLRGAGESFCSGGDIDEFGASQDVPLAHLVRLDRSVAARIEMIREHVSAEIHGACIGAGIELASFASHVVASPGTRIVLPELAMGLVPGAGGTVGITRRIGRWRTAFLALTGDVLGLEAALRWGLVDEIRR